MSDKREITLTVNDVKWTVMASPDMVLIDLLREDLRLTGTKQSCDRKGQCGACTVIVDGKAVRSCITKVINLEGSEVTTIEGLGTPDNPHLIQEAFVLTGAIQCGYCTPGMIMTTKVLLDQNKNPELADIKKAFSRNLCRCTGYVKIIDAIKLAARFMRGETTPEAVRNSLGEEILGVSHPRPSAMLKACGVAKFTADYFIKGALEIAAVHSTEFHAIIKSIDTSEAEKMPGVVGVMTAKDVPGTNRIRIYVPDQPILCDDVVRTYGDPVAIVAAETRDQVRAAAAKVKVVYEPLPVVMTPEEALAEGAPQIHKHSPNLTDSLPLIKGDAEKALKESVVVVEGEFTTQLNHQAPMEPEVCVAYLDGEGKDAELVIIGRSINIHGNKNMLVEGLGYDKIQYQEPFTGGQFGIKAMITSEGIAGAAALHFKRPIRYIPSMQESFWLTTKRHIFKMKVKLAADANGKITAYTNDMLIDKGAYYILGTYVLTRPYKMLQGSYHIPNIKALGRMVYTNNAPGGSARGFGPPQTNFALESAVDMLAEKLGIDPLDFRRMNSLKPGQTKATGMVVQQWPFPEVCDLLKPHYDDARKAAEEFNKSQNGPMKRGVGLGAFSFGIGDSGDQARLFVECNPDDSITIYAAVADPGEGNDSMLTQIAAHILDIPMEKIHLYARNTDKTVGLGPAAGSRMTFMAGGALVNAVENLKLAWKEAGSKTYQGLKDAGKPTRYEGYRNTLGNGRLDPETGQGGAMTSDVQNIQMAEVEVNTETGMVRVIKMTVVVDAGTIIHPINFQGQNEGGMDQGVGYALREEYVAGKTKDYVTFKFPTINNVIEQEVYTRETPRVGGPLGATGIGEMTMISTAPAVTNAIANACGARIFNLPATPDKVKAALKRT
ncbi:MAG: molybdopterin cofactor-binding domain-containing protein [Dehalococcoidales bacterium]|jgi:aldehyde oxidoreductase